MNLPTGEKNSKDSFLSDVKPLRHIENVYIKHVYELCGRSVTKAAKYLKISRMKVYKRIKESV
jgi:transcriptional regulator with PAS, ATPase and Fis domain